MKEYIKKFANPAAADQYAIKDIPFIASVDGDPIQNLHCNLSGKKLVNVDGIVKVQSAGPEMVDLGLSVKWASANLGATNGNTKESWYGNYYAWGETEPKTQYEWTIYKYANGAHNKLTKYCDNAEYGNDGFTDNLTQLVPEDDIATVTNSAWRIPTKEDFEELLKRTTNSWVTNYNGISGLNGRVFTKTTIIHPAFKKITLYSPIFRGEITDEIWAEMSLLTLEEINAMIGEDIRIQIFKDAEMTIKADYDTDYGFAIKQVDPSVSMFIPAAGSRNGFNINGAGYDCNLWSSSLVLDFNIDAYGLDFNPDSILVNGSNRCCGFSVRAVQHASNS